jgi:hypothetical protein
MLNRRRYGAIGGITGLVASAGLVAACSTTTATKAPSDNAPTNPPTTQPAPTTPSTTGPVGTTFQITDSEAGPAGNRTAVYTVQAAQVLDPAAGANSFDAAPQGQHLVGVEYVIKGVSGATVNDSADNDGTVQGSNGQIYQANFTALAAGTDFASNGFTVSPGTSETGWEGFQLPDGVSVKAIMWTPDQGNSTTGLVTWTK